MPLTVRKMYSKQTAYLRSHWSTKFPFSNDTFSTIMSGRRFDLLMKYFHLNDSEKQPPRESPNFNRQYKIRPLLDMIVCSFQSTYVPGQHISVDETMIGFKGRLAWIQFMPKKPTKWGIKAWVAADATTGYVWNFHLYTGQTETQTISYGYVQCTV